MKQLSENAQTVLAYLKAQGGAGVLYTQIAEDTGLAPKSVNAIVTHALVKRGLAARNEIVVTDAEGKEIKKKEIVITAEGSDYDATEAVAE